MSKTLTLERDLGWTGVLIEAEPKAFSDLRRKQRKAFLADVCLSTSDKPQEVTVNQPFPSARIPAQRSLQHPPEDTVFEEIELKCLPIFSILATLNKTTVDFFSLNAHGAELKVLQTIPFHSLFIKIFSIENILHVQGRRSLMDFMASKGYQRIPWNFKRTKSNFLFVHTKISSLSKTVEKVSLQGWYTVVQPSLIPMQRDYIRDEFAKAKQCTDAVPFE
ncbi:unnamed protein product [Allacma fusca]|uniref:Methyltransferase FkbM domain-containing protein n=1 Tax=Allacma fusca TaxID=39272 RepID=A0A8J2PRM6_9HEXA|nr:unnamed protein product [Allacma fusca]